MCCPSESRDHSRPWSMRSAAPPRSKEKSSKKARMTARIACHSGAQAKGPRRPVMTSGNCCSTAPGSMSSTLPVLLRRNSMVRTGRNTDTSSQPADPVTLQIVISAGEEDGDDEGAGDVTNKSVQVRLRELLKVHHHEDRETRLQFGSRGRWSWRHSSHHHRADREGETNTLVQKHESVTRRVRRGGAAAVVPNGVGLQFTQEIRQRGRGHPRPPGINSCPRYRRGVRLPSAQRPARPVARPCVSAKRLRQQLPHADDRDPNKTGLLSAPRRAARTGRSGSLARTPVTAGSRPSGWGSPRSGFPRVPAL
ncbi:hypothetical protein T492DRAFT_1136123 [Pavlovales sp. CCMP2436]|nr:hypothetical protein T492DRAFT_1136123 [Pavlovales sp. CCMP2436]